MSTAILYNQIQSIVNNVNFLSDKINELEKNNGSGNGNSSSSACECQKTDKLVNDKIAYLSNEVKSLSNDFKIISADIKKLLSSNDKSSSEQNIMTKVEQFVTKCTKERIELNNVNTMLQISSLQKQIDNISVSMPTDADNVVDNIDSTSDADLKKKKKQHQKKIEKPTEITIE
jgi:hypothetical protein